MQPRQAAPEIRSGSSTIIVSLSADRFGTYRAARSSDAAALALYEWNAALCASFYVPLQAVEVGFRNACHGQMQRAYGSDWIIDDAFKGQDLRIHKEVESVSNRLAAAALQKSPTREKFKPSAPQVVAGLSFGFWTSLLGKKYDRTFWRNALNQSFPEYARITGGNISRPTAAGKFDEIRAFRNRVFHHEPIFRRKSIQADYDRLLEAASWISSDLRSWVAQQSAPCASLIAQGPPP